MSVAGSSRSAAGGHRVEPAGVPGVAARNAPHAEPDAAQQAEAIDGLDGVVGARGMESTAGTEERTEGPLIAADQADREQAYRAAHAAPRSSGGSAARRPGSLAILCSITFFHSAARLACSSAPGAPRDCGRALTTRSTEGRECWCSRNDSRTMRRMRLRSTALPAVRTATAMPRRAPCLSLLVAVTAKNPLPKRRPRAYAASNSDLRRRRLCGGKVSRCISSPRPARAYIGQCHRPPVVAGAPGPRSRRGRAASVVNLEVGALSEPLRNQLPAPLGATAGQHLAAVLGRHACPEPVRALATHFARLIGTLHGEAPEDPWGSKKGRQG